MKPQLLTMLSLQDKMNTKVHPDWRAQQFDWYRAVWTECAELMDHHGWKWWKKQTPDTAQIHLEIVDIWHFGMSILLQEENDLEQLAYTLQQQWSNTTKTNNFLVSVEMLASNTLSQKTFSLPLFCQLMILSDLSFDQLHRQYVGKNVLNFFRQDHGYKEGTYHKLWHGKEDNEHLAELLIELDAKSSEFENQLYVALASRYPKS